MNNNKKEPTSSDIYCATPHDENATKSVTISFRVEAICKAKLMCLAELEGIKLPNLYREIIHDYLRRLGAGGRIVPNYLNAKLQEVLKAEGIINKE